MIKVEDSLAPKRQPYMAQNLAQSTLFLNSCREPALKPESSWRKLSKEVITMQVTVPGPQGRRIKRGQIKVENGVRIWETRVQAYRRDGRPKHLFAAQDAWTLSSTILGQLQELGVDRVRFVATDLSETYQISLSEFFRLAEPLDQSKWSGRTEKQYALPRKYWEKTRESANRRQLALQL